MIWKEIFTYAVYPEVYLDKENIIEQINRLKNHDSKSKHCFKFSGKSISDIEGIIKIYARELIETWQSYHQQFRNNDAFMRDIVTQSAPFAAVLGAWLQGLSAPGVFESQHMLSSLSLLADDFGGGEVRNSRKDRFEIFGQTLGLSGYSTQYHQVLADSEIDEDMFCFPAILLLLSRRSDAFVPELLGIDFLLRSIGVLPAWRHLENQGTQQEMMFLDFQKAITDSIPYGESPMQVSRQLLVECCAESQHWERAIHGMSIALHGLYQWHNALRVQLLRRHEPRLAMALLLQDKSRAASIYHHGCKLNGKSLRDWFKGDEMDPFCLVDILAESRFIRPGRPDVSPLITSLVQFNGPMFRIFDAGETIVIRDWIYSLGHGADQSATRLIELDENQYLKCIPKNIEITTGDENLGVYPEDIRQAYYFLQGRALTPRASAFAIEYIEFWLDHARESVDKTSRSLPAHYQARMLKTWILEVHDRQSHAAIGNPDGIIPDREDIISQAIQLAPLTLIDGSWLQGFTDIQLATSRYGAKLFKTYWDELGNGVNAMNHPKVYRDVLRTMDVEFPPTGHFSFAYDPRFEDASFELPVYWLCLGKKPISYLPEILGMNLAMELSGVGGSYMNASKFLRNYNFSSMFVDLHNTIDNVSTGHSAWAVEAIDNFMAQYLYQSESDCMWQRIRTGYESLSPIVDNPEALNFFLNHPLLFKEKTIIPPAYLLNHDDLSQRLNARE